MKVKAVHLSNGDKLTDAPGTLLDWTLGRGVMVTGNGQLYFPESAVACVVIKEPEDVQRKRPARP